MKIALCTSSMPFASDEDKNIMSSLEVALQKAGHKVEKIFLPEISSYETCFQQLMAYRWISIEGADRLICFRPQSSLMPHPHKILWFLNHFCIYDDILSSPYGNFTEDFKNKTIQDALKSIDHGMLAEAKMIYAGTQQLSNRFKEFSKLKNKVLSPPAGLDASWETVLKRLTA